MDIYEDIVNGKYNPIVPTASVHSEDYDTKWAEYNKQCEVLEAQFKKDALDFVGLTNHPKANEAFEFAQKLAQEICEDNRDEDTIVVHILQNFAQLILPTDESKDLEVLEGMVNIVLDKLATVRIENNIFKRQLEAGAKIIEYFTDSFVNFYVLSNTGNNSVW